MLLVLLVRGLVSTSAYYVAAAIITAVSTQKVFTMRPMLAGNASSPLDNSDFSRLLSNLYKTSTIVAAAITYVVMHPDDDDPLMDSALSASIWKVGTNNCPGCVLGLRNFPSLSGLHKLRSLFLVSHGIDAPVSRLSERRPRRFRQCSFSARTFCSSSPLMRLLDLGLPPNGVWRRDSPLQPFHFFLLMTPALSWSGVVAVSARPVRVTQSDKNQTTGAGDVPIAPELCDELKLQLD